MIQTTFSYIICWLLGYVILLRCEVNVLFGYKLDTISGYDRFLTSRLFLYIGEGFHMDMTILNFIQNHLRSTVGDHLFPVITALGNAGLVWLALAAVLLILPRTRKLGLVVTAALVLEAIPCNLILKPLVARARPFTVNPAVELLITKPTDFSFPSGHTSASFAVVSALFFRKERLWIPAGILAALIAFSRLYLYVHYPTDVLAGALVGILAGWIAVKGTEAIQIRRHAKI